MLQHGLLHMKEGRRKDDTCSSRLGLTRWYQHIPIKSAHPEVQCNP